MKTRALLGVLFVMALTTGAAGAQRPASPAPARVADQSLTCAVFEGTRAQHERRALRMAPEGARRPSAHTLAVNYKGGVHRFIDKKPYREELDGFHWSYCGYFPGLGAHLIGEEDGSLFTGKLLLDRDGRVLDGGQTVYPSPDGTLFLAASQEDGAELEQWVLSDLSGRRLWAGDSGVTNNAILVEYQNPRWTGAGVLQVTAICGDKGGARGEAALVHEGGAWRWRSNLQCKG